MSVSFRRLASVVLALGVALAAPGAAGAAGTVKGCDEPSIENNFCAKKEKPQKGKVVKPK